MLAGSTVSIHAPVKGRHDPTDPSILFGGFNPRPREGATPRCGYPAPISVSIHAPVKGRRCFPASCPSGLCFNPRPREGATYHLHQVSISTQCFNPRPREGATGLPRLVGGHHPVSIHAPVKGRLLDIRQLVCRSCFNPRPREGATRTHCRALAGRQVSIHAPVKGRLAVLDSSNLPTRFNPRPREGATLSGPSSGRLSGFNPRPREGATCLPLRRGLFGPVSIHAPVKGRRSRQPGKVVYYLFQSTPP